MLTAGQRPDAPVQPRPAIDPPSGDPFWGSTTFRRNSSRIQSVLSPQNRPG